jgi:hypothetical protein
MSQSWNDYIQTEELANEGRHVFKSLQAVSTLLPATNDIKISIKQIDELPDDFEEFPWLEPPMKAGDICFLYAQEYYLVECEEVLEK